MLKSITNAPKPTRVIVDKNDTKNEAQLLNMAGNIGDQKSKILHVLCRVCPDLLCIFLTYSNCEHLPQGKYNNSMYK